MTYLSGAATGRVPTPPSVALSCAHSHEAPSQGALTSNVSAGSHHLVALRGSECTSRGISPRGSRGVARAVVGRDTCVPATLTPTVQTGECATTELNNGREVAPEDATNARARAAWRVS